ncbi:MAG: hypothetical protein FD167_417 [bacterium]|nr:MAG: hypothetical protein FD167_417 [bacterium]
MEQLALILHLQWLLFKNSLRSQGSKLELVARIIFAIASGIVDIIIAVGLFMATLFLSHRPNANAGFIIVFCAITLYWQIIPLLSASFGGSLSISNFRLYPISDKKLLLLDLISGATDITSLSVYLPLLGILIASIILEPFYSPITIIVFALFILFNIALSRYLQRVIEKLLAYRRIKELLVVVMSLIILSFSFVPMIMFRQEIKEKRSKQLSTPQQITETLPEKRFSLREKLASYQVVIQVLGWSPPGLVTRAAINLPKETVSNQLAVVFLSILFSGLILLLVQRKIKYEFYGSSSRYLLADKPPIVITKSRINRTSTKSIFDNSLFNLLPLHAIMVFEKELKYFYRSSKMLLIFLSGILGAISFALVFRAEKPTETSSLFAHFMLPGLNFYSLMVLGQFFTNSFGFDSHGAKTFFLMPIKGQNVLLGKNLAVALIALFQTSITAITFNYLIYPISVYILLNTILSAIIGYFSYAILGNFLSVFYPQKMEFSNLSSNNYSKMALLLMILMQGFVFSILAMAPIIAWYSKTAWVSYPIFVVELIIMLVLYKISLNYAGKFFEKRVEEFLHMLL